MLVVQRVLGAKRTNLHEKYDYPKLQDGVELDGDGHLSKRVGNGTDYDLSRYSE